MSEDISQTLRANDEAVASLWGVFKAIATFLAIWILVWPDIALRSSSHSNVVHLFAWDQLTSAVEQIGEKHLENPDTVPNSPKFSLAPLGYEYELTGAPQGGDISQFNPILVRSSNKSNNSNSISLVEITEHTEPGIRYFRVQALETKLPYNDYIVIATRGEVYVRYGLPETFLTLRQMATIQANNKLSEKLGDHPKNYKITKNYAARFGILLPVSPKTVNQEAIESLYAKTMFYNEHVQIFGLALPMQLFIGIAGVGLLIFSSFMLGPISRLRATSLRKITKPWTITLPRQNTLFGLANEIAAVLISLLWLGLAIWLFIDNVLRARELEFLTGIWLYVGIVSHFFAIIIMAYTAWLFWTIRNYWRRV